MFLMVCEILELFRTENPNKLPLTEWKAAIWLIELVIVANFDWSEKWSANTYLFMKSYPCIPQIGVEFIGNEFITTYWTCISKRVLDVINKLIRNQVSLHIHYFRIESVPLRTETQKVLAIQSSCLSRIMKVFLRRILEKYSNFTYMHSYQLIYDYYNSKSLLRSSKMCLKSSL